MKITFSRQNGYTPYRDTNRQQTYKDEFDTHILTYFSYVLRWLFAVGTSVIYLVDLIISIKSALEN